MRSLRTFALGILALTLVACSSATPGWTYAPAPAITPAPSTQPAPSTEPGMSAAPSAGESAAPSAGMSAAPSAGSSAAPSATAGDPGAPTATKIDIAAVNIAFDKSELAAPADEPFQIVFANNDAGVPHNVEIKDSAGTSIFKGEIFPGVETRTYDVPALAAGSYTFICTVHPNMAGTLTVG